VADGKFTIYLTKAITEAVNVGWFVVDAISNGSSHGSTSGETAESLHAERPVPADTLPTGRAAIARRSRPSCTAIARPERNNRSQAGK
jgi:hypothetical protein